MKIVKLLLLALGFLSLGLGTVGIFLPVLPTTPFYLLATLCFAKSSVRFHRWFTNTKLYKKHLESFANNRSLTIKTKLTILLTATVMLIPVLIMVNILLMRIVIGLLLLIKWWYFIFKIKTTTPCKNISI